MIWSRTTIATKKVDSFLSCSRRHTAIFRTPHRRAGGQAFRGVVRPGPWRAELYV